MNHSAQLKTIHQEPGRAKNRQTGRELAFDSARKALQALDLWGANQQMGHRWPVGCVALEITQRCNLDCRACYLAHSSKTTPDEPIKAILAKIDAIHQHYGRNTNVQITGGEPTMRSPAELLHIVRHVAAHNMNPTLMTNGLRLNRSLLVKLVRAGLRDVAFHVDTTQSHPGLNSESDLNELRRQYISMTRGLPVSVYFNTTVWSGNYQAIPDLVEFFIQQADVVRIAAFQLQAHTGRGTLGRRRADITQAAVIGQIEKGTGIRLNFDSLMVGHPDCSRTSIGLVVGNRFYDMLDNPRVVGGLQAATHQMAWLRVRPKNLALALSQQLLKHPQLIRPFGLWAFSKVRQLEWDIAKYRERPRLLALLIHGFMDAEGLDADRLSACAFKTMTDTGPVSMCQYNANREHFLARRSETPKNQTSAG